MFCASHKGATEDDQKASCSCVVSVFFYKYTINTPADPPHIDLSLLPINPSHRCLQQQLVNGLTSYFNLVYVVLTWQNHQRCVGAIWIRVSPHQHHKKKKRWFVVVSSSGYLSGVKSESNSLQGDSAYWYSSSWRFAAWQLRWGGVKWPAVIEKGLGVSNIQWPYWRRNGDEGIRAKWMAIFYSGSVWIALSNTVIISLVSREGERG